MRASVALPLMLCLLATPASAAKWVSVTEGATRAIYVDSQSLQRDGNTVQGWTREVFVEEQRSPHTGVFYYSANTLTRFDCYKRTIFAISRVFYGGDGTELRRIDLHQVDMPALVAPGSLQERLLEQACKPPTVKKPATPKVEAAEKKPEADAPQTTEKKDAADPAAKGGAPETAKPSGKEVQAAKPPESTKAAAKDNVKPSAAQTAKLSKLEHSKTPLPSVVPAKYIEQPVHYEPRPVFKRPAKVGGPVPGRKAAKRTQKPAEHAVHWGYDGKGGPEHWADLSPDNAACGVGKRQSPIDIRDGARLDLEAIRFDYRPSELRIIDNGHTVQVNYAEGSSISVAGVRYELKQFHFHKPSEERINGKVYDMVAHLVHRSLDGRLAVVAVLMEAGLPNAFIGSVWPYLPLEAQREFALPEVNIDINALLPESRMYYTYMGSLTTPPCTEGVLWLVMKTPVSISMEQAAIFGKLYDMNARPVQAGNGRLIKESL